MDKLKKEMKKHSVGDEGAFIKQMATLKEKVESLSDDFECPGCGDYGTNEFI